MSEFEGQVVLVTGAGAGLGRAIAEAFAARGAHLAVNDITPVNLDETVRRIRVAGGQVRDYVFDIAARIAVGALVDGVIRDWGRLDVLVNCATVAPQAALLEMDEWDWHRTLEVNLGGAFNLTQVAGRRMREQGSGAILHCIWEQGYTAAVQVSRLGLVGLVRAAARELVDSGVRVNALCPEEVLSELALHWPLAGAIGQANDPVAAALFLCSQAGAHLNGEAVAVAIESSAQPTDISR